MATTFQLGFVDQDFEVDSQEEWRRRWGNVPNVLLRTLLAAESQYLQFHRRHLEVISYYHRIGNKRELRPINRALRAIHLKHYLMSVISIAEAVLRAHGEERGYRPLVELDARNRTFGKVVQSWTTNQRWDGPPRTDVAPIWTELMETAKYRNTVHLFESIQRHGAQAMRTYFDLEQDEERLLTNMERVFEFLLEFRTENP